MTAKPILFADFQPGAEMGRKSDVLSARQLEEWGELYPSDRPVGEEAPMGLATVLMMRAYLEVVSPRPPGNLHVRQDLQICAPVRVGEEVTTTVTCLDKELRKERRVVRLAVSGTGANSRSLFDGIITLFWAA